MDTDRAQLEVEQARERVSRDVHSVVDGLNVVERTKESLRKKVGNLGNATWTRNTIGLLLAGLVVGVLIGLSLPIDEARASVAFDESARKIL